MKPEGDQKLNLNVHGAVSRYLETTRNLSRSARIVHERREHNDEAHKLATAYSSVVVAGYRASCLVP